MGFVVHDLSLFLSLFLYPSNPSHPPKKYCLLRGVIIPAIVVNILESQSNKVVTLFLD